MVCRLYGREAVTNGQSFNYLRALYNVADKIDAQTINSTAYSRAACRKCGWGETKHISLAKIPPPPPPPPPPRARPTTDRSGGGRVGILQVGWAFGR